MDRADECLSWRGRGSFTTKMTNRKLKFGLGIAAVLGLGFGIPVFAVWFTNKKLET
eukprot:jgi/Pico_ML_1/51365/g2415.t1